MDEKNIPRREFIEKTGKLILATSSFGVVLSCSKDSPTQPSSKSICFKVDGFDVYVHNMWRVGTYHTNVRGLVSFDETVSMDDETHTLEWTNINNDYTIQAVTSFDVKIDGENYSYPADQCSASDYDDGY